MSEEVIARFAQMGFSFVISLVLLKALLTDISDIKKNITSMFALLSETKTELKALSEDMEDTKGELKEYRRPPHQSGPIIQAYKKMPDYLLEAGSGPYTTL